MRTAQRKRKLDLGISFGALGFVVLCIVTFLIFMEFVIIGVRALAG